MAITNCGRGHVYDPDQYAACPYCNGGLNIIDFGETPGPNRTVAPAADLGKTVAPGMIGGSGAGDIGKTVSPYESQIRRDEQNRTVAQFVVDHGYDPVVGWLVCIAGPANEKGRDYRIMARLNFIGRGAKNDIVIGDPSVSQEKHASIQYDVRTNSFCITKENGQVYVDNELVKAYADLHAYSVIEMGKSSFVFVPLCCDLFKWDVGDGQLVN